MFNMYQSLKCIQSILIALKILFALPIHPSLPGTNPFLVSMHEHVLSRSVISTTVPQAVAHQVPLSVKFSRQEYWSWLPFPPPGDLSNPGGQTHIPALAGRFFTTESPGKPYCFQNFSFSRTSYDMNDIVCSFSD